MPANRSQADSAGSRRFERVRGDKRRRRERSIPFDLVIEIKNEPGALARVAAAVSDAGVNLAAATCMGTADNVELHVLVPHAEAARHALAISQLAVTLTSARSSWSRSMTVRASSPT